MIALIVAMSENGCIGKEGSLPWHLPEDLQRVKKLTTGKAVIMGRKTWESIPKQFRPLPQRTNIVITRQDQYTVPEGVEIYSSIGDAIAAHEHEDIVSFGGASIYAGMLDFVDTLYITRVHQQVDGDTFFPEIDWSEWREAERKDFDGYSFLTYVRS